MAKISEEAASAFATTLFAMHYPGAVSAPRLGCEPKVFHLGTELFNDELCRRKQRLRVAEKVD